MPDSYKIIESRKFMWDGKEYPSGPEADAAEDGYKKVSFETKRFEESGKFLVYTRRTVKAEPAPQ